jgi:hypothetical protein
VCWNDDVPPDDFLFNRCGHGFCSPCWAGHIRARLAADRHADVPCMEMDCEVLVHFPLPSHPMLSYCVEVCMESCMRGCVIRLLSSPQVLVHGAAVESLTTAPPAAGASPPKPAAAGPGQPLFDDAIPRPLISFDQEHCAAGATAPSPPDAARTEARRGARPPPRVAPQPAHFVLNLKFTGLTQNLGQL